MNKPTSIILLSLCTALLIIGVHQTMTLGFAQAYWIFMLMIVFLLIYINKKKKASK